MLSLRTSSASSTTKKSLEVKWWFCLQIVCSSVELFDIGKNVLKKLKSNAIYEKEIFSFIDRLTIEA